MSVLENFKNILRSPYGGRQGSNVIFFLQICNEVSGGKKKRGPVAPPTGDRPLSPTPGATGSLPPILTPLTPGHHSPPFPLLFEPKNSEKKRGVRRRKSGETLPNCVLVIYR